MKASNITPSFMLFMNTRIIRKLIVLSLIKMRLINLDVIAQLMQVDPQLWALSVGSIFLNAVLIIIGSAFLDQMRSD